MTKPDLQLLLVDFDGVLSNGRFYTSQIQQQRQLGLKVAQTIFAPRNQKLLNDWMRGDLTYHDVHDSVAASIGADARQLDRLLEDSVKRMPLNEPLLQFIGKLRSRGIRVSLLTNNMDIFDLVARAHHNLDTHFDHIYSSSAHGQLKLENDALITRAMQEAAADIRQTALVDDSTVSYELATGYGVSTFLYQDYLNSQADFEHWLEATYAI
jgi:FMN phosphatase YigB (HAD superfamily)